MLRVFYMECECQILPYINKENKQWLLLGLDHVDHLICRHAHTPHT